MAGAIYHQAAEQLKIARHSVVSVGTGAPVNYYKVVRGGDSTIYLCAACDEAAALSMAQKDSNEWKPGSGVPGRMSVCYSSPVSSRSGIDPIVG